MVDGPTPSTLDEPGRAAMGIASVEQFCLTLIAFCYPDLPSDGSGVCVYASRRGRGTPDDIFLYLFHR